MELDDLKSSWNSAISQPKTENELGLMLKENRHPVLKRIRKQITIETAGWLVLLLSYYSMFDGADKPLIANAILVIAVLAALLHNLTGYSFSKNLIGHGDIKTTLQAYLKKIRIYATLSITLRAMFVAGLLVFFCWNVTIDSRRYALLGAGLILLLIQLFVLGKVWTTRLKVLSNTLNTFTD